MKTIIYARVSTEKDEQHASITEQIKLCREYAQNKGLEVTGVYHDEQSGKNLDRPGIREALGAMALGDGDVLLAVDFDRVTRETGDIEKLQRLVQCQSWQIWTLEQGEVDLINGIGVFSAEIKTAASKYLRIQLQEKVRRVMERKQADGEKLGGLRPFGFSVIIEKKDGREVKKLVPCKREQNAIALIKRLRDNGMSMGAICKELRRRKIKNVSGHTRWHKMAVSRILKRK